MFDLSFSEAPYVGPQYELAPIDDMIEQLKNLPIHPTIAVDGSPSTDLLSEVLAQVRLTGNQVLTKTLAQKDRLELEAKAAHVCVVTEGALHIKGEHRSADRKPVVIDKGDLTMLPHGTEGLRLIASRTPTAVVLCRFHFDMDSLRTMTVSLPHLIHIRRAESVDWLDGLVHFLTIEAADIQPGAALMVSRLIDVVVIRTLRTWIHQGPASGWLAGLSDARIARALKVIHERPMQRWSIKALAGIAGMSRSNFCECFTALVGRSPLRYHKEWRLTLARELLARRSARVGEIGLSIGYESEAAFSRAYKTFFGHPPRADIGRKLFY